MSHSIQSQAGHGLPMILVVDYGSQYTQLIARKVREMSVYSEVIAPGKPLPHSDNPILGVILSGGPQTATGNEQPIDEAILALDVPLLGICYGMQAMAIHGGGLVKKGEVGEYGHTELSLTPSPLWAMLPADAKNHLRVWMSHEDHVVKLPEDFHIIAASRHAPIAAMAHKHKPWFALQFHPEVSHTEHGDAMLAQFVQGICQCPQAWQVTDIETSLISTIQEQVGQDHVLLGLSGGVDSSVLAALLHKAIGDQLTCVFVDTGLLRRGEADQVMTTMHDHMAVNVIKVDASERFFQQLQDVTDPETKRKICGELFVEVFQEQSKALRHNTIWLAQGTIYPDVIESGGVHGTAEVIKSHHNVGGLPETLGMPLLEPLRMLFKDEIRLLGKCLGLSEVFIGRHPFPGPGLCLRVIGEVTPERVATLQACDAIFIEELHAQGWYNQVAQAFALLLPVMSVGVVGDQRAYAPVVGLRAVTSIDYMTAEWADLPRELLTKVSSRIVNEVPGVSRVVYDITHKPPATIEWE